MESTTPAAPAQPGSQTTDTTPQPVAATAAAILSNDTGKYREARRAERAGKPLEPVTMAPKADAPADGATLETPAAGTPGTTPAAPVLTRKEREQNEANERVRRAVELATADLRKEVETLRRQPAAGEPKPAAAAPAAPVEAATWQDTIKSPDPRLALLGEQEYFAKYPEAPYAAYTRYAAAHDRASEAASVHEREHQAATQRELETVGEQYGERLKAAGKADPDLKTKIAPDILEARPISGLTRDAQGRVAEPITFANFITEIGLRSPAPAELYKYLTAHPDEADTIAKLPGQQALEALLRLDGRLSAGVTKPAAAAAAAPTNKTVSDAPASPNVVGNRAAEATDPRTTAIRTGNTSAYRELRRQERAAGR
jgi:hypothetical protein